MRTLEEVLNYFTYHAPDEQARELHERVGNTFQQVVEILWESVPPFNQGSPDKTVMFRCLSDARMQANMAIACYVPPVEVKEDNKIQQIHQAEAKGLGYSTEA